MAGKKFNSFQWLGLFGITTVAVVIIIFLANGNTLTMDSLALQERMRDFQSRVTGGTLEENSPTIEYNPFRRNSTDAELLGEAKDAHPRDGMQRIAFLFIVRGDIPHELLWRRFFHNHDEEFSLYVHASPGHVYPKGSLFERREIPSQPCPRFSRGIVDALRRLLAHAVLDRRYNNQWFINVCESTIPIRSFPFIYNYLTTSTISFVESFYPVARYHTWDTTPELNKTDLRKGELWMALHRDHAKVVISDTHIYSKFLAKCTQRRMCTWDEQYIQTLLHLRNADGIAKRTIMYVNWSQPHGGSPKVLQSTASVIKEVQLRTWDSDGERHDTALDNTTYECVHNDVSPSPCFLFARKFARGATQSLLSLNPQELGY